MAVVVAIPTPNGADGGSQDATQALARQVGSTSDLVGSIEGSLTAGTRFLTTFARIASERVPEAR